MCNSNLDLVQIVSDLLLHLSSCISTSIRKKGLLDLYAAEAAECWCSDI